MECAVLVGPRQYPSFYIHIIQPSPFSLIEEVRVWNWRNHSCSSLCPSSCCCGLDLSWEFYNNFIAWYGNRKCLQLIDLGSLHLGLATFPCSRDDRYWTSGFPGTFFWTKWRVKLKYLPIWWNFPRKPDTIEPWSVLEAFLTLFRQTSDTYYLWNNACLAQLSPSFLLIFSKNNYNLYWGWPL